MKNVMNLTPEEAKARAKEIRRQFAEMDEQQKALEELRKRISSQIRKDLNVPIQYFKSYEEIIKKISEQSAPLKNALEKINRLQSTTKNYLTPTLQRLTTPIKQIEEQMKKIREMYNAIKIPDSHHLNSEIIISSDMIRAKQEAETMLTLKSIETLLQKSLSKDKEKPMQAEIMKRGNKEILKLSPEIYGVGINLKLLLKKIRDKLRKKNNKTQK